MANRSDESGREEATYGRSGNPQERQQLHEQNQPWREPHGNPAGQGQQHVRDQGMQQGLGQRGTSGQGFSGQGFGEFGERAQGWESERGSDFYGGQGLGQRGQNFSQGSHGYGPNVQGYGQGSERYGQGGQVYGQGSERFGQGGQGYGQQQDWQRGTQTGWQGGEQYGTQYGTPGYGAGQGSRLLPGQQGLGEGGMAGGYGGMSGGYGGQQLGYGSGLGQRSFRGIGPKNYTRSDERIREDVCERLTRDDDLDASEIEVKAEQGVVTLDGSVEERWMKHRAEDIAETCSGVREVENRIRVESGLGKARSGAESLGRSGSQGESRTQSGSTSSGSTPH